jgi:hypothetical protein
MIRYELQAELYGLSAGQRSTAQNFVNNALANETIVGDAVVRDQTVHGSIATIVEASFTSRASGDRILNTVLGWASTRASDAPDGRHSYVWFKEVDDQTREITVKKAESPAWVVEETIESLRIAG